VISKLRRPAVLLPVVLCAVIAAAVAAKGIAAVDLNRGTSVGKITIGYSAWPGWFPWSVAAEQKFFAANGVNVEMKYFDNYTDSLAALADGTIDANSQTLNDTLISVSAGAKQTIVLVNDNSTGNDQIICAGSTNGVADLKGKKVGVEQGTVDHFLLLLALKQSNLTQQDIELEAMSTDAAAAALVAGDVDCAGVFAPFTTVALARPGSFAIATSAEFPGAIPDHLVFRSDMVEQRPTDVQAVVNTWFWTLDWIKANGEAAIKIMADRAGVGVTEYTAYDAGTSIFTRQQNLDAFQPGTTADHLNAQANIVADFMVEAGLVQVRPSLDALFDSRFIHAVPERLQ
jgi:NitT/TauT family transport system substrate-binding protein